MSYTRKRILERVLAMCLAIMMVVAMVPTNVYAVENAGSEPVSTAAPTAEPRLKIEPTPTTEPQATPFIEAEPTPAAPTDEAEATPTTEPEATPEATTEPTATPEVPMFAEVSTYTGGTVEGSGTANTKVVIEETTLQWVAKDESIGRNTDGWWVGIKVVAPEGYSPDATYMSKGNPAAEYTGESLFEEKKDGDNYIGLWFPVSPESLIKFANEGRNLTLMYTFNWDAEDGYDQEITFSVVPSGNIVLMDGEEQKYPYAPLYGEITPYTGGEVTGSATANTVVKVKETTLQWVEKDESIGRNSDGWWVGIKAIAPEGFSADATYKSKGNPKAQYGTAKKFSEMKDGDNYIGLWFPVSPESIEKFISESRDITMMYTFDWNGDAVYEQEITFSVVPSNDIVLMKGDWQEYPIPLYTISTEKIVIGGDTNEGGCVLFDGVEAAKKTVERGTQVKITAKADEGYQIASLNVGGATFSNAVGETEFSVNTQIGRDVKLAVTYVRVYTVTITCDANGTIKITDPDSEGGSVVVNTDSTIKFNATPNTNYRVEKVEIRGTNDADFHAFDERFVPCNDTGYAGELTADQDYQLKVTFALNVYTITIDDETDTNGTIDLEYSAVDYGNACEVAVSPDTGYSVTSVKVNGVSITDYEEENGVIKFTVSNITEDQVVTAEYAETSKIEVDVAELIDDENAKRVENTLYVYANGATATFSTTKDGIILYDENGNVLGGKDVQSVEISESVEIGKIELVYKDANEMAVMAHEAIVVVDEENVRATAKIVFDELAPEVALSPAPIHNGGYYNGDFQVALSAIDGGDYSGVKKIEYFVIADEESKNYDYDTVPDESKTESGEVVFAVNATEPNKVSGSIAVTAEKNNTDYVCVWVKVTDKAGNVTTTKTEVLKVCVTEPKLVSVEITGTASSGALDDKYYASQREVTIKIQDRTSTFDGAAALGGIEIVAKDATGQTVDGAYKIGSMVGGVWKEGEWTTVEGTTPDKAIHTVTIRFIKDANYEWSYTDYVNVAGNSIDKTSARENGDNIYVFTVDTIAPSGSVTVKEKIWASLLEKLTFGIYDNVKVDVTALQDDATSPYIVEYYKVTGEKAPVLLSHDELDAIYATDAFGDYSDFSVIAEEANEQFVVYLRITDYAGNYTYVSSDGVIVDNVKSVITLTPETPNSNGIYGQAYSAGIKVDIVVTDSFPSSGIKSVDYKVIKEPETVDAEITQSGNLYTFVPEGTPNPETGATPSPVYDELLTSWDSNYREYKNIIVKPELNNSSNVRVLVTAVDNAGNTFEEYVDLDIDMTAPAIDVKYVANEGETVALDYTQEYEGRGYFKGQRTAKVTITERTNHFDEQTALDGIKSAIAAVNAVGTTIEEAFSIGSYIDGEWNDAVWTTAEGATPDAATHTITIRFEKDAKYDWSVAYTDMADNANGPVNTGNSQTPFKFAVDTTNPTGELTINGNKWSALLEKLTFGIFSDEKLDVKATYDDKTSPFVVECYKVFGGGATNLLSWDSLDTLYSNSNDAFVEYEDFTVEAQNQFVVYLRITDYAGNYIYINTDGAIVDSKESNIELTEESTEVIIEEKPVYDLDYTNDGIQVGIEVTDDFPYSGIKSVDYKVIKDGNTEEPTQEENLYTFVPEGTPNPETGATPKPVYDELKNLFEQTITIEPEINNSSNVQVVVTVVDNADNMIICPRDIDIDITRPGIEVEFVANDGETEVLAATQEYDGRGYFKGQRTAKVIITERTNHFDGEAALNGIQIEAVDAKETPIPGAYSIGSYVEGQWEDGKWITVEGDTPDEATHTITIRFEKDANYEWSVAYTDMAGNANEKDENDVSIIETHNSETPFKFAVDTTNPTGVLKATIKEDLTGAGTEWTEPIATPLPSPTGAPIVFNIWSREQITIEASEDDDTSPIDSVKYYKTTIKEVECEATPMPTEKPVPTPDPDATATPVVAPTTTPMPTNTPAPTVTPGPTMEPPKALTAAELDQIEDAQWVDFPRDEEGKLDKLTYSEEEQFAIYLQITDKAGNYIYLRSDGLIIDATAPLEEKVKPMITVEPMQPVNGIYNSDVTVDVRVLDPMNGETYSGLKKVWYEVYRDGQKTQPVEGETGTLFAFGVNNPSQVELVQKWEKEAAITVDKYLNNSNDVKIVVYAIDNAGNESKKEVPIMIDITPPRIKVWFDNNDAQSATYFRNSRKAIVEIKERNFKRGIVWANVGCTDGPYVPGLSEFTYLDGEGDESRYTATIQFVEDGDYTFHNVFCVDEAGNESSGVDWCGSVAPSSFTIDHTWPVVNVAYDNNSAQNGNYYNQVRTATVTVTEHNFAPERIELIQTASDDGTVIANPVLSAWSSHGDVHTATLYYGADARYTFDINIFDKAGNSIPDYVEETFYVDTTAPALEISGVVDESANSGDVSPVVTYSDTNYDADRVSITLTGANRKDVPLLGSYRDIHNGRTFYFRNFEKTKAVDDIYTLNATLTDKAGNTSTKEVQFSVNRFGSTYELSESAAALNGTYAKEPIDVKFAEINADALSNIKVTLFKDGETIVLKEGVDYEIELEGGYGNWYRYNYNIFKENFSADGIYSIVVESDDAAGNSAKNDLDTKNAAINFGIDSTYPIINIENLESKATYAMDNLTVQMSIRDNLKLVEVFVEMDGKKTLFWDGETLEEIIRNGGNFSFDISGDSTDAHNLVVYAIDAAGNGRKIEGATLPENVETVSDFYVTTNLWVRYYTNKPLFFGTIGGVIVLASLIVFLVAYKRRKSEEK